MNPYRKTIVAVVGAAITFASGVVVSPADAIAASEWLMGAIALGTALGVYGVSNSPDTDERGYSLVEFLAIVAVTAALVLLILWGVGVIDITAT